MTERVQDVVDVVEEEEDEDGEATPAPAPAPATEATPQVGRPWATLIAAGAAVVVTVSALVVGISAKSQVGSLESQMDNKADVERVEEIEGVVNDHAKRIDNINTTIAGLKAADSMRVVSIQQVGGIASGASDVANRALTAATSARKVAERLAKEAATRAMIATGDSALSEDVRRINMAHSSLSSVVDRNQSSQNRRWASADSAGVAQDSVRTTTERRLTALESLLQKSRARSAAVANSPRRPGHHAPPTLPSASAHGHP